MKKTLNPFENAKRIANGAGGGSATILPATADTIGGVKIGEGINVTEDGTISVPSYTTAYSYDEVDTGKKWVDGKAIYRKCISVATLPNKTTLTAGTLASLDTLVLLHGEAKSNNQSGYSRPLPFVGNVSNDIRVDVSNYDVVITTTSDWSSYSAILVIEYTKTGA
jgi:hypothetical protein